MDGPRDLNSGEPVAGHPAYREIADRIRELIEAGVYPVGERLPIETVIAAELGVSRVTVNRAVRELVDEGQVEIRRGVGAFVAAPVVMSPRTAMPFLREAMAGGGKLLLRLPSGQTRRIHIE